MSSNKPIHEETSSSSAYIAQFIADLKILPQEKLLKVTEAIPLEDGVDIFESIRAHVVSNPNRIPSLFALVVRDMPYYPVLRHLEWINLDSILRRYEDKLSDVLGEARLHISVLALTVLDPPSNGRELSIKKIAIKLKNDGISDIPEMSKVQDLDAEISAQLVSIDSLGRRDLVSALKDAQDRAVKAENILSKEKTRWDKQQRRLQGEQIRSKQNAAAEAKVSTESEASKKFALLKTEFDVMVAKADTLEASLADALQRLREIDEQGGATPEKVQEIRSRIMQEADELVKKQVSEEFAPWLAHLKRVSEQNDAYNEATKLSRQALELAKKEAIERDPLLKWQYNRSQAVKALEIELDEIGKLIDLSVNPSEALVDMHRKVLSLLSICRAGLDVATSHGGMVDALLTGIKKSPDENIDKVIQAINTLGLNDVIGEEESEILVRALNNEKTHRSHIGVRKVTSRMKLSAAMYANEQVDILLDGYNFMHGAGEMFSKYLSIGKKKETIYFSDDGKKHLAKLLSAFQAKNANANVHVFFDGKDAKDYVPADGVEFHKPHIVTSGKDQADAEIIDFLFKKARKGGLVIAITDDKVIQRAAAIPMSVEAFKEYLTKINKKGI